MTAHHEYVALYSNCCNLHAGHAKEVTYVTAHEGHLAIPPPTDPSLVQPIIKRLMIDLTKLGSVGGVITRFGNSLRAVSSTSEGCTAIHQDGRLVIVSTLRL